MGDIMCVKQIQPYKYVDTTARYPDRRVSCLNAKTVYCKCLHNTQSSQDHILCLNAKTAYSECLHDTEICNWSLPTKYSGGTGIHSKAVFTGGLRSQNSRFANMFISERKCKM